MLSGTGPIMIDAVYSDHTAHKMQKSKMSHGTFRYAFSAKYRPLMMMRPPASAVKIIVITKFAIDTASLRWPGVCTAMSTTFAKIRSTNARSVYGLTIQCCNHSRILLSAPNIPRDVPCRTAFC